MTAKSKPTLGLDWDGTVSAYPEAIVTGMDCDAYGNTISTIGDTTQFSFWFSTKYRDTETGWYYYGYRYYDPITGRWQSKDPIKERGGKNLYGFARNNSPNKFDPMGLSNNPGDFGWSNYSSPSNLTPINLPGADAIMSMINSFITWYKQNFGNLSGYYTISKWFASHPHAYYPSGDNATLTSPDHENDGRTTVTLKKPPGAILADLVMYSGTPSSLYDLGNNSNAIEPGYDDKATEIDLTTSGKVGAGLAAGKALVDSFTQAQENYPELYFSGSISCNDWTLTGKPLNFPVGVLNERDAKSILSSWFGYVKIPAPSQLQ